MQVPIVLVQMGSIPKYLERNLKYLAATFPSRAKYLITDQSDILWIKKLDFRVIKSEDLIPNWPEEFMITDRRRHFRNNFWFSTKARLLLLPKFMRNEGIDRLIHVENDVWIHPNFPFNVFEGLNCDLAFPLVDEKRGIASTMFVRGKEGVAILESACRKWPESTDMEILGKILASGSGALELASTYTNSNESLDGWIFDGAKLGMYLFGSDAKNSKGIIKRFSRSPMGDLSKTGRIMIEGDRLVLVREESKLMIASLHIHSKNLRIFSNHWKRTVEFQLLKEQAKLSVSFDLKAFLYSMTEVMLRIFRKIGLFTKR